MLIHYINLEPNRIRFSVIKSLGKIADPLAGQPLSNVQKSDNKNLRREAAWALGIIGVPAAGVTLIEWLTDSDK